MVCAKCGSAEATKKCGQCHAVSYCSRECQRDHWKTHKKQCSALAKKVQERNKPGPDDEAHASAAAPAPINKAPAPPAKPATPSPAPQANATSPSSSVAPSQVSAPAPPAPQTAPQPAPQPSPSQPPAPKPTSTALTPSPSAPYVPPPNLSAKGKDVYGQLKSVLEAAPEAIAQSIVGTPFCEATTETERRVDTRVLLAMHELLRETIQAEPESAVEVFKRMLAIKALIKHADDAMTSNWCWIIGQQCLSSAQRVRLKALQAAAVGGATGGLDSMQPVQLTPADQAHVDLLRRDALFFLQLGVTMFGNAVRAKDARLMSGMSAPILRRLSAGLPTVLGYALRYMPGTEDRRRFLWTEIAGSSGEQKADPLSRGLAAYALAYEACCAGDEATWSRHLAVSAEAWSEMSNPPMQAIIERHKTLGCTAACRQEMQGVMDGNELKLGAVEAQHQSAAEPAKAGNGAAPAGGQGMKGGARLVPGRGPGAGPAASSLPTHMNSVKALEQDMKRGYEMYEKGDMEGGIEHFGKVLKRAYELPLTGVTVSVIFSLSHAHIEGCAQTRKFGKAEATCLKLKELAAHASEHGVPQSIPTTADRLHLWWREKRANLHSRQKQHDKALGVLTGAVPHAEAVGVRFVSAVHVLLVCCHVEQFLIGSASSDMPALQGCINRGVAALRAEPPPVGGDGKPGQLPPPVQQWVTETKLEQWVKVLPMLRSLEGEGLELDALEGVLLPLAERYGLQVGETFFNAAQFAQTGMKQERRLLGRLGECNALSVMFGFAVVLPVLMALWLALYSLQLV